MTTNTPVNFQFNDPIRTCVRINDKFELTTVCVVSPQKVVGSKVIGPMVVGFLSIPSPLFSFSVSSETHIKLGFYRLSKNSQLELMSMSRVLDASPDCMAFSTVQNILVTVDKKGTSCVIWSMNAKETAMIPTPTPIPILIKDQPISCTTDKVIVIAFHPTNGLLAMGTDTGKVILCRVSDDKLSIVFVATFNAHEREITSIVFDPFNRFFATTGWDGAAILWRLSDDCLSATRMAILSDMYDPNYNGVRSIAFDPTDQDCIVTGDGDGRVKMWDISEIRKVCCKLTISGIKGTPSHVGFIEKNGTLLLGIVNGYKTSLFQIEKRSVWTLVPVPLPLQNDYESIMVRYCSFDWKSNSIITLHKSWPRDHVEVRILRVDKPETKRPLVDEPLVDEPETKRPRVDQHLVDEPETKKTSK